MQVELQGIKKSYKQKEVISDLNLQINSGELVSIVGPSGCGKSTTLYMIAGLEAVSAGKIVFGDQDVTSLSADKREIGLVFQNYALYPHLTVFKNIAFPLTNLKISKEEIKRRTMDIINSVGLEDHIDKFPGELSGGQQQRVAIARAIVKRPQVLLLDEPLSNLDAKLKMNTIMEIKRIQRKFAITTIFVTHDQQEAMAISDRMIVLNEGIVQQVGLPNELYRNPKNSFVAQFIGSPNINTIKVEIKDHHIVGLEQLIASPINLSDGSYLMGIRPEAFFKTTAGHSFEIHEEEILGRDILLYSSFAGEQVKILVKNTTLSYNGNIAEIIMQVAIEDVHFFDVASGNVIAYD